MTRQKQGIVQKVVQEAVQEVTMHGAGILLNLVEPFKEFSSEAPLEVLGYITTSVFYTLVFRNQAEVGPELEKFLEQLRTNVMNFRDPEVNQSAERNEKLFAKERAKSQ